MDIQIKNLKKEKPKNPWDVRIDRKFSILANIYAMKNESERDKVCDDYKVYFKYEMENDDEFRQEIYRLVDIYLCHDKLNLFCWCAPLRCHGETIAKQIKEEIKEAKR